MPSTDLIVDKIYTGGRVGNASDDPLGRLVGVSNSGGFRYIGSIDKLRLVVLTTSFSDRNWPDEIDKERGIFTYYGDNKRPGRELHDTPRLGNEILRRLFDLASDPKTRIAVPPILAFASTGTYRDVVFLGLMAPGSPSRSPMEDLAAIWRTSEGQRFQNYRARFTILEVGSVRHEWLNELIEGSSSPKCAPAAWMRWKTTGRATPLLSPRSLDHRSKDEQLPTTSDEIRLMEAVRVKFAQDPHGFEYCAAALTRLHLPGSTVDVTRPTRDGGRDGIGKLIIGAGQASIAIDFALEAKCYGASNSVGTRELSRLISRLRHRQFGVLVTTSYVDRQAYREIKEDGHPIIVISASDIVSILKKSGINTVAQVNSWLEEIRHERSIQSNTVSTTALPPVYDSE